MTVAQTISMFLIIACVYVTGVIVSLFVYDTLLRFYSNQLKTWFTECVSYRIRPYKAGCDDGTNDPVSPIKGDEP